MVGHRAAACLLASLIGSAPRCSGIRLSKLPDDLDGPGILPQQGESPWQEAGAVDTAPVPALEAEAPSIVQTECERFVPKSVHTTYRALPWVAPCKCPDGGNILWGYGQACDPQASNGFNAKKIFEENSNDLGACACIPSAQAKSMAREGQPTAAAAQPAAAQSTCGSFVPKSISTNFAALPWVAPCKCPDGDNVLWGYGTACEPKLSNGFNAKQIFEQNAKDLAACACITTAQAKGQPGQPLQRAPLDRVAIVPNVAGEQQQQNEEQEDEEKEAKEEGQEEEHMASGPVVKPPKAAQPECGIYIPRSVQTSFGNLPWVHPCKCPEGGDILWGYGVACDPELTSGFDAQEIYEANSRDRNACACIATASEAGSPLERNAQHAGGEHPAAHG